MKILFFTHSIRSCWNHGNAHFLRGVMTELEALGHTVEAWEPRAGWSITNLVRDHGEAGIAASCAAHPGLRAHTYDEEIDAELATDGADVVVVHEWTAPSLVAKLGRARRRQRFTLLFHDTHHRAVSDARTMRALPLEDYDGILAFGASLAEVWSRWGFGPRAFVWHEAADTRVFTPRASSEPRQGLVFVGNWGDEERSRELIDFLLAPAAAARLPLDVFGVRYPMTARAELARFGARYKGWLPNVAVPETFARHLATVHVPRRLYAMRLPGIPTIRVFEALAAGIPLLSAPWLDSEGLFRPGRDYLVASDRTDMKRLMRMVACDGDLRAALSESGLARIRERHTCAHRARELLDIVARLDGPISLDADAKAVA